MKKFNYNPGERVWHKGTVLHVVGTGKVATNSNQISPGVFVTDNTFQAARPLKVSEVEPVISDVFNIGDEVETGIAFKGRVVAFEEETNRAVCVSHISSPTERKRFAYKYNEITKVEKPKAKPLLTLGNLYELSYIACGKHLANSVLVKATIFEGRDDLIRLVSVASGWTVMTVPADLCLADLPDFGLMSVELKYAKAN